MPILDAPAYPHILQEVLAWSSGSTLCVFLRASSFSQDLALPFLYPEHLIDPLIPLPSHPSTTACSLHELSKTMRRRIDSFLSSPHLGRCKQITITHCEVWAQHLSCLRQVPLPARRTEGTVTTIRIEPWVKGSYAGLIAVGKGDEVGEGGGDGRSQRDAADSAELAQSDEYDYRKSDGGRHSQPTSRFRLDGAPPFHNHFRHTFNIASLLPSTHLVLRVPAATKPVHITSLLNSACGIYKVPEITRRLTVIVESGHSLAVDDWGQFSLPPKAWEHVELVFVPDASGVCRFSFDGPNHRGPIGWATQCGPKFVTSVLTPVLAGLPMPVRYTVVGLEIVIASAPKQTDSLKVTESWVVQEGRKRSRRDVRIDFEELEQWKLRFAEVGTM